MMIKPLALLYPVTPLHPHTNTSSPSHHPFKPALPLLSWDQTAPLETLLYEGFPQAKIK